MPKLYHIKDYRANIDPVEEANYEGQKEADNKIYACKITKNKMFDPRLSYWEFKDKSAKNVDPDEAAHHELPHLGLRCLQITIFNFGTSVKC